MSRFFSELDFVFTDLIPEFKNILNLLTVSILSA